jgi:integrase
LCEHALISVLALNGLHISEALGANVPDMGIERSYRTLLIRAPRRRDRAHTPWPPAPPALSTWARAHGWRAGSSWPRLVNASTAMARPASCPVARLAGITKRVTPPTLGHAFMTAALDAGVPLRDVQEAASHADARTTLRYDRARLSHDPHATYIASAFVAGPPGTSSPLARTRVLRS